MRNWWRQKIVQSKNLYRSSKKEFTFWFFSLSKESDDTAENIKSTVIKKFKNMNDNNLIKMMSAEKK